MTIRVRQDDSGGLALDINGPETASASYQFTHMSALMAFAEAQQQKLLESGFQLHAVVDRRGSGGERRPGGGPERRRARD